MDHFKITGGKYTFSLPTSYTFFVNNIWKICIISSISITILPLIANDEFRKEALILILLILLFIPIPLSYLFSKFANKVTIDFDKNILILRMNRSNQTIEAKFSDIQEISKGNYIVFKIKNRKIFYNNAGNNKLIACLNKIMSDQHS